MWVMELVLPELSLAPLGTATAPRRDAPGCIRHTGAGWCCMS